MKLKRGYYKKCSYRVAKKPGLNHEIFKKSLLIIEIKWLADFYSLKICFFLCNK